MVGLQFAMMEYSKTEALAVQILWFIKYRKDKYYRIRADLSVSLTVNYGFYFKLSFKVERH